MHDAICIGDAMIDAFLTIHNANAHSRVNKKDCELCVKYGEKILVDSCCFLLGGGACNASVGLSRLGLSTALCIETGDDEFSQKIISGLRKEKVDLSLVQQTEGKAASFSMGLQFKGERTLFVEHATRKHEFNFNGIETKWVFLEGLGHEWKKAYEEVQSYIEKGSAKLALAIGSTQLEEGQEILPHLIAKADVMFVNKEEAQRISNFIHSASSGQEFQISNSDTSATPREENVSSLLLQLQKMGAKVVSITDGEKGSFAINPEGHMFSLGTVPCKMVEKTGAGDAYASGFLSAIMDGKEIQEAMRWGAVNAASVIEHMGAQEGLLTKEQIQERLGNHSAFQARQL